MDFNQSGQDVEATGGGEFSIPENDRVKTEPPPGGNVGKGILLNDCTSFLTILKVLDPFCEQQHKWGKTGKENKQGSYYTLICWLWMAGRRRGWS